MKDIKTAPFLVEICRTCDNMYRLGWDERNGGNISMLLDESEIAEYIDVNAEGRVLETKFDAAYIGGRFLIVTGTGQYFKNVSVSPETCLGIIKIADDGKSYRIVWGFEDGGRPTSELPTHLMNHIVRLKADKNHRVVTHTHPTNVIAMSFVHSLDEKAFTKTLWRMITECVVVFPDGIGVLPWMVCGNEEIGVATAAKMDTRRCVVWAQHGIFGSGTSLDEAFGLIETVEKAAQIYMMIKDSEILQTITDDNMKDIAKAFGLNVREGYLD